MGRHKQGHVTGWRAVVLAPVAIPALIIAMFVRKMLGKQSFAHLSTTDVERNLRGFLDGNGGEWDWDDFTSIPISDPALDRIRQEADAVDLPLTDRGEAKLRLLLERVRAM